MKLAGVRIGFAVTGSFCTLDRALAAMQDVVGSGAEVTGIVSQSIQTVTTRFGTPDQWLDQIRSITGSDVLCALNEVEPIGPRKLLDVLVIAPCTGATMARIANGISDTPVTMAAKAQLRNGRPVVLAIATNDGLGLNARNLGQLLVTKNMFMVPFRQDNPEAKPNSLEARLDLLVATIKEALAGRQLQPVLAAGE